MVAQTAVTSFGISVARVSLASVEARELIAELDGELRRLYPGVPIRSVDADDAQTTFLIASVAGQPAACGAIRQLEAGVVEIKRMYVRPAFRRRGLARQILEALERVARDEGSTSVRLGTGNRQPEALCLYESAGYQSIPAFGEYVGFPLSRCFEKRLM